MQGVEAWPNWVKRVIGVSAMIFVIAALAGCGETGSDTSDGASAAGGSGSDSCGIEATDDCTPRVGAKGKVQVDGLVWQVKSVETSPSIGDPEFGLSEEANGIYLVAHLKVRSTKDESVSLSDEVVKLVAEGDGNTYSTDSDGTFAASIDGEDAFIYEDIGPNNTLEGVVVFDVPKSLLKSKTLELEFGELGFGSTKGYIAIQ